MRCVSFVLVLMVRTACHRRSAARVQFFANSIRFKAADASPARIPARTSDA